jgi:hypothetical protein
VNCELRGFSMDKAMEDATNIYSTLKTVLETAKKEGTTTVQASDAVALGRLNRAKHSSQ